jgi:deoxycytidylate deaminase
MNDRWLGYYFHLVKVVGSHSHCERDKVGAIAVRKQRIIATGYNGTVAGDMNGCEGLDGETRPEVVHAEINLLCQLARSSESSEGCTVFISRRPCLECAKALLSAGIYDLHCIDKSTQHTGSYYFRRHGNINVYSQDKINELIQKSTLGMWC